LAGNVADTEWVKIQAALEENVKGDSSRAQLQSAIDNVLGSKTFAGRAETIARTELTHAYNTGRIETFSDNGVEAVRRYCIIDERTCPQCAGLNGMVANLNDWGEMARIYAPSHPRCRCTISPLLNIRQLAEANRRPPPLPEKQWMVERILKSVIS
jgi:SPP1 gp7 family putative phage head morphogenesis protein